MNRPPSPPEPGLLRSKAECRRPADPVLQVACLPAAPLVALMPESTRPPQLGAPAERATHGRPTGHSPLTVRLKRLSLLPPVGSDGGRGPWGPQAGSGESPGQGRGAGSNLPHRDVWFGPSAGPSVEWVAHATASFNILSCPCLEIPDRFLTRSPRVRFVWSPALDDVAVLVGLSPLAT